MLSDVTTRRLAARLAADQRTRRLPSVVAGVVRGGGLAWCGGCGDVVEDAESTQYRIGSITKTFVAVDVMRLRDEGRLRLSDPVVDHVADAPTGAATVGQLLSHSAGVRAETAGPWWERTPGGDWSALVEPLAADANAHEPGRRFHYSNVGYAVLGELVARLRETSWEAAVRRELLAPLEMARTTAAPVPPHASGMAVHPWADVVLPEPAHDAVAMGPAGQLWSTIGDLARWAAFLAGDTGDVLSADTLAEMQQPVVVDDRPGEPWSAAYGLGLQVWNASGRRFVGHGGSMPGFVGAVRADVLTRDAVVALTNSTAGFSSALTTDLHEILDDAPPAAPAWAPSAVPAEALRLTGHWYWGPSPFVLRVLERDILELCAVGEGRGSRFRPDGDGTWLGLDAYFAGERLRVMRDDHGTVTHLDVASFVLTRAPYDPAGPVPGGVDEGGWRGTI